MKHLALLSVILIALAASLGAQTPCYADYDGPVFDDNTSMGGPWIAIPFTPPAGFTATRLEVFTGEATGLNTLALYTHDAANNQPGSQLMSAIWNATTTTNAWQGAQLSSQIALNAGGTYWLIWIPVGGAQASVDLSVPGLGQPYRASFDNGLTWSVLFQDNSHWKFRIFGTCSSTPIVYCTAGTTSNGCAAAIFASQNPNVAHSAPCQIAVANVEGQRAGIIFYGLAQTTQPWCSQGGGSSFLCVKAPTVRTGVQSSGGALGSCNGSLALDWNAYQLAHPTALGAPWTAGERVYLQGWFRDPTSCKTTSLSNALELTYLP